MSLKNQTIHRYQLGVTTYCGYLIRQQTVQLINNSLSVRLWIRRQAGLDLVVELRLPIYNFVGSGYISHFIWIFYLLLILFQKGGGSIFANYFFCLSVNFSVICRQIFKNLFLFEGAYIPIILITSKSGSDDGIPWKLRETSSFIGTFYVFHIICYNCHIFDLILKPVVAEQGHKVWR